MLGVVTSSTMKLHPFIPNVTQQTAVFSLAQAPDALRWWSARDAQLPVNFDS